MPDTGCRFKFADIARYGQRCVAEAGPSGYCCIHDGRENEPRSRPKSKAEKQIPLMPDITRNKAQRAIE